MIPSFFTRRPSYRDLLLAEAQTLVDDGYEADFVLDLYPDEADWLEPLLRTSELIIDATGGVEPSFYFEASLKARFVAVGEARAAEAPRSAPVPLSRAPLPWLRSAFAGTAVVALSGFAGIITLGFVTAGQAVPGDWNYSFKIAGERVEYVLATGDDRVSIELRHKQERVHEFDQQLARGSLTQADVDRLRQDLQDVLDLAHEHSLDPLQKASARAIGESSTEILTTVRVAQPELAPAVDDAITVAAGIGDSGTVSGLDPVADPQDPDPGIEPVPAATETVTPEPTETASATPQPAATETLTPVATVTAAPIVVETPTAPAQAN